MNKGITCWQSRDAVQQLCLKGSAAGSWRSWINDLTLVFSLRTKHGGDAGCELRTSESEHVRRFTRLSTCLRPKVNRSRMRLSLVVSCSCQDSLFNSTNSVSSMEYLCVTGLSPAACLSLWPHLIAPRLPHPQAPPNPSCTLPHLQS